MTQAPPTEKHLAKVQHFEMDRPVGSVNTFKQFMEQPAMQKMLRQALVKHLTHDRLMSMVTVAISRTPRLRECTPLSLFQGCLDAALCGCVSIGGSGARGYLVPYKNGRLSKEARCDVYEAQFQSSYLGLCDMARRSKEIAFIDAFPVFKGDKFEYSQGFESKLVHVPNPDPKADRTKAALTHVYAIARYLSHPLPQFRVLNIGDIEAHRARSRSANDGPWVTDYIAMGMKSAVRDLAKWLPQTPEMQDQLSKEAEVEFVDATVLPDLAPGESRTDNLASRLAGNGKPEPVAGEVLPAPAPDPETQARIDEQVAALQESDAAPAGEPEQAPEEAPADGEFDFNTRPPSASQAMTQRVARQAKK